MVKLLLIIILLIVIYVFWKIYSKIDINQINKNMQIKTEYLENEPITFHKSRTEKVKDEVDLYEYQLFDDVSSIFIARNIQSKDKGGASQIQEEVLRKMPLKTKTVIRQLELEEWSIYWRFYDQSLEYYVGKYGVFITHVDRDGKEHKVTHA